MIQIIEPYFGIDSQNLIFFWTRKIWLTGLNFRKKNELFFEYDSTSLNFFWIRLTELNIFLNTPEMNWTRFLKMWLTEIEPSFFKRDSKNWTFFRFEYDSHNWTFFFTNDSKILEPFLKIFDSKNWNFFSRLKVILQKWSQRLELFWIRPTELNFLKGSKEMSLFFFFECDSQNWTFFFSHIRLTELNLFFWIRLKEIDFSRIWRKEFNRFISWMWRRELNRLISFIWRKELKRLISWLWCKELNRLVSWIWLKDLNFCYELKTCFFLIRLTDLNPSSLNMTQRIELFESVTQRIELFENMTQRIELFWKYDSKIITLFAVKMTQRIELFLRIRLDRIELFFEYDSKNLTLFWIRLKELNLFLNDSKNWSFFFDLQNWTLSFLNMTQRLELVFEYDSKNWTSFL